VENSGDPRKVKTKFNSQTWKEKNAVLRKATKKLDYEQQLEKYKLEAQAGAELREKERIERLSRKLDELAQKRPVAAKRLSLRSGKKVSKFSSRTWNEKQKQLMNGIDEYASLSRRNRKSLAQILREFQERVDNAPQPGCEPITYDPIFLEEIQKVFEPPQLQEQRISHVQEAKRPMSAKNQEIMAHWNAVATEMKGKETVGDAFRKVLEDKNTRSIGKIPKRKNDEC
jgi:hypothetical protein